MQVVVSFELPTVLPYLDAVKAMSHAIFKRGFVSQALLAVLFVMCWGMLPLHVAAEDEVVPDAMGYMVKGPDVDIESLRDPFQSQFDQLAERNRKLLLKKQKHLADRKREKLEDFALSELKLVAIFSMADDRVAMVEDNSGKGYMVRRNNYIGRNSGRVEKIMKDSVLLIESALDPAGDLVEREIVLTLKEVNE